MSCLGIEACLCKLSLPTRPRPVMIVCSDPGSIWEKNFLVRSLAQYVLAIISISELTTAWTKSFMNCSTTWMLLQALALIGRLWMQEDTPAGRFYDAGISEYWQRRRPYLGWKDQIKEIFFILRCFRQE